MDIATDTLARLRAARGFVLDMDGTLVLGDRRNHGIRPLPGAVEMTDYLLERDLPLVAFTNGTARTPADYADALGAAGFSFPPEKIATPARVAGDYFARQGLRRVMVMGIEGVWRPIRDAGMEVVTPPFRIEEVTGERQVDAIFVGWFREVTLDDIEAACNAVWGGAALYSASMAPFFASAEGRALGSSVAIVSAIRGVTGCEATVLGKPSVDALHCVADYLGVPAADLVVVGDDPTIEPVMARQAGALAVGVETGFSSRADYARVAEGERAELVVHGIDELFRLYRDA